MQKRKENDDGKRPVVMIIGEENTDPFVQAVPEFCYVSVSAFDWNRCLSPWPAEKVFRKGEDFAGEADTFLTEIVKEAEKYRDRDLYICGYSLAGLFALYAAENTDLFKGCASVSGSLWYPDWLAYLQVHPVHAAYVYLSVGDKEKKTGSPVMSRVEDCTRAAEAEIGRYAETFFELNAGGHFGMAEERIIKALKWLLRG